MIFIFHGNFICLEFCWPINLTLTDLNINKTCKRPVNIWGTTLVPLMHLMNELVKREHGKIRLLFKKNIYYKQTLTQEKTRIYYVIKNIKFYLVCCFIKLMWCKSFCCCQMKACITHVIKNDLLGLEGFFVNFEKLLFAWKHLYGLKVFFVYD